MVLLVFSRARLCSPSLDYLLVFSLDYPGNCCIKGLFSFAVRSTLAAGGTLASCQYIFVFGYLGLASN